MAAAVEVPTAETTGHAPATEADVVIVGSGFSGLGTAIRLKKEGFEDFVVLERGDEVGGTWWFNTYPGCACDVPSHLYSFSFAPNPDWSETYSKQPEIRDYLRRCADELGVRPHLRFGHTVISAAWTSRISRTSPTHLPSDPPRLFGDGGRWRSQVWAGTAKVFRSSRPATSCALAETRSPPASTSSAPPRRSRGSRRREAVPRAQSSGG